MTRSQEIQKSAAMLRKGVVSLSESLVLVKDKEVIEIIGRLEQIAQKRDRIQ